MSQEFYTLLTEVGAAQLANAIATKTPLRLTEIAVGDGGGSPVTPSESQVSLINEVWRGQINQITDYENNQNWLAISVVIPQSEGGFYVREAGIFDETGHLFAVASYPETYKPALSHGSALDLHVRLVLQISNTDAIRIEIDPSVILCTRKELLEHDADPHAHALITKQVRYQDETVLNEDWDPEDATQLHRSLLALLGDFCFEFITESKIFTAPRRRGKYFVIVQAAGGGGSSGIGGSGGGGGCAIGIIDLAKNQEIEIIVGKGGTGAINGATAENGGDSRVGSLRAGGGNGGNLGPGSGGQSVGGIINLIGGDGIDNNAAGFGVNNNGGAPAGPIGRSGALGDGNGYLGGGGGSSGSTITPGGSGGAGYVIIAYTE